MEEDYKKVLKQIKLGYDKSVEMLQTKKMQKLKLTQEIDTLTNEIQKLNYDITILSNPQKKDKIVLKQNGLWKDILGLFISMAFPFIAVPSLAFTLATNTGWKLLLSKVIAIIATFFIPSFIVYFSVQVVKNYRKTTDDLIDADVLIKNGSLEKSRDWLDAKISKKIALTEELEKVKELISTLTADINSYTISYNTILTKLLDMPSSKIPMNLESEQTLIRRKD